MQPIISFAKKLSDYAIRPVDIGVKAIATFFWIGKIEIFGLFFASLCAFISTWIYIYDQGLIHTYSVVVGQALWVPVLCVTCIAFVIGELYLRYFKSEVGRHEMILDVYMGQLWALWLVIPAFEISVKKWNYYVHDICDTFLYCSTQSITIITYMLAIGLLQILYLSILYYRPWPMQYCDRLGLRGVEAIGDDLIAGLYSALVFYMIAVGLFGMPLVECFYYIKDISIYVYKWAFTWGAWIKAYLVMHKII